MDEYALPATYLQAEPSLELLSTLSPTRFDCILIDPPASWAWEQLAALPVPHLAANPTFVWLWCGSGNENGLEKGRELLAKWGYRRCEDIVWVKTNRSALDEVCRLSDLLWELTELCRHTGWLNFFAPDYY